MRPLCLPLLLLVVGSLCLGRVECEPRTYSIEDFGAVPDSAYGVDEPLIFTEFHEAFSDATSDGPQVASASHLTGLVEEDDLANLCRKNTAAFNRAIQAANPGDTVLVPEDKSFSLTGGVFGEGLHNITIDFAGTLHFVHSLSVWPFVNGTDRTKMGAYGYKPAIYIYNSTEITLTCSSQNRPSVHIHNDEVHLDQSTGSAGIINGNGKLWWDEAIMDRLPNKDDTVRPRLLLVNDVEGLLIENLTLLNSPFWTVTFFARSAEVRYTNVLVDRSYQAHVLAKAEELRAGAATTQRRLGSSSADKWFGRSIFPFPDNIPDWVARNLRQPEDLNTDGIDPMGENIWVHDCIVQNSDDSIAVKPNATGRFAMIQGRKVPCTRNVSITDMVLTGFGASVGSVGPAGSFPCVDDITFRNISMPATGKGIYIKSNQPHRNCRREWSSITNILYEDVVLHRPFWWSIWIGPQQQHEPGTKLGQNCPIAYPLPGSERCPVPSCSTFQNITLRNIRIEDPLISPGAILANASNPFRGIHFDNVRVIRNKWKPWRGLWPFSTSRLGYSYQCKNAVGTCKNCHPAPSCLEVEDET